MGVKRKTIRIGTRGSELAMWQAMRAHGMITDAMPEVKVEIVKVKTQGDKDRKTPLKELGGVGVFVKAIEQELVESRIDIAVHSAKDLPSQDSPGLIVAGCPPRGVINDVLVCREHLGFHDLPHGAVIGTSSPRRAAQLKRVRSDLIIRDIRGNVDTRLKKVDAGEYDATVLAWAGLRRLGLAWRIDDVFPASDMLPAPGQGIVALQCRREDDDLVEMLSNASHQSSLKRLHAERSFLATLQAGCHAAVAGVANDFGDEGMSMTGRVMSLDGSEMLEEERSSQNGEAPEMLGRMVAEALLKLGAGELIEQGAK